MVHTQRVDGSQANFVFDNILNLQGRAHNHAFVSTPVAVRVATIEYARWVQWRAESEKNRQRVSNADGKVFATSSLLAEEFPDILENVQTLYKISRWYAKCPDELESFRMI